MSTLTTERQMAITHMQTIEERFPEFAEWQDGDNYPYDFPYSPELVDAIRLWFSVWKEAVIDDCTKLA